MIAHLFDKAREMVLKIALWAGTLWLLVHSAGIQPAAAGEDINLVERGNRIFGAQCAACHTIGGGKSVGPDLKGVVQIRDRSWLFRFISDPENAFRANDVTAHRLLREHQTKMPNPGLSAKNVTAVIAFLETQSGAEPVRAEREPGDGFAEVPAFL
jgi:mono/diheme cytochrome c family protein